MEINLNTPRVFLPSTFLGFSQKLIRGDEISKVATLAIVNSNKPSDPEPDPEPFPDGPDPGEITPVCVIL
jgi:hypothetical protein